MATTAASEQVDAAQDPVWRKVTSWVLLVVFCVGLLASVVTVWARVEVLNTDAFVHTVSPLAADPDIQMAIADRVTDRIGARLQSDDAIISSLGDNRLVRGVGLSLLLETVHRVALNYLQSPSFPAQWDAVMEAGHRNLIAALTGDREGAASIQQGQLVLDLTPVVTSIQANLVDRGLTFVEGIEFPPDQMTFVMFESDTIANVQELIEQLETLSIVLPIVTLIALAVCLVVAPHRWGMVAGIGVGSTVAMVVLVILIAVGRRYVLDSLGPDVNHQAATDVFDIVVRGLKQVARVTAVVGIVVAAVGWVGTSSLVRRPSVVAAVRRYRGVIVAALIVVPCLAILLIDDPELIRVGSVVLVALTAIAMIFWISRMNVSATRSDGTPSVPQSQ